MQRKANINYPFTAIVAQEKMKKALILNMIYPKIGGVLITGEKGTAKSTMVKALADIFEDKEVVALPIGSTEDKVVGTLDIEHAIKNGEKKFEPGLLARAHNNILYVDEINLLEDHIVDLLLDVAAMGVNVVEREGISHSHFSNFVLIGTMNPEEGEVRPQLLDRFGLQVEVSGEKDIQKRMEIIRRRMDFEASPELFLKKFEADQRQLAEEIEEAQKRIHQIKLDEKILELIAGIAIALGVDGHRADLTMVKTSLSLAAFHGQNAVEEEHVYDAAELVLPHRMRQRPMEGGDLNASLIKKIIRENARALND